MTDHDHRNLAADKSNLDGVRMVFNRAVEDAIMTPSKDERSSDKVVWLIWIIDEDSAYTGIPSLHAICSTEHSIRYHVGALLEKNDAVDTQKGRPRSEQWFLTERTRFHVERAPLDHAFGSSLLKEAQWWQMTTPPISVGVARKFEFGGD